MNRIQELIKELCPNGVEWKKLGEVLDYEQPSKYIVKSTEYSDSYNIPVLTAGQSFILGYTNEKEGVFYASNDNPVIIFDDFTTSFHWVNFDFKVKSSAMKMLRMRTNDVLFRYVYHYMLMIDYAPVDHSRQWIGTYSVFPIPVPPLPVQTEIVRILDKFVEQQKQLEKLIELRTKQYEYYREEMLTAKEGEEWKTKTLGECCKILKGKYITQKDSKPGPYPVVLGGQEPAYYIDEFNHSGEVIAVSRSGVSAGFISYWNQDIFVSDGFMLEPLDCSYKYLYMYLKSKQESINSLKRGAGIPHITTEHLKELVIPIFPSSKENEIVNALDSFESSISALTSALELSKKRYEHYRDELLRF